MAHLFNESDPAPLVQSGYRTKLMIAFAVVVVAFGIGAAILWYIFGWDSLSAISFMNPRESVASERTVSRKDIQDLQQQIAQSMQSTEQLLAAQQAETKRLSDQLILLSGKVDLLQGPAASVDEAVPAATPSAAPRLPKKSKFATKKPSSKPAGAISTGGAPLPLPAH